MMDSNNLLQNNLINNGGASVKKHINWAVIGFVIVSFLGFLDALYLVIEKFTSGTIKCIGFSGCDTVINSPYASILGIPLSLLGAIFYLAVFSLTIRYMESRNEEILRILHYLAVIAFLFALYLIGIQVFALNAFCTYCVVSAITSTLLFVFSFWLKPRS